MWYIVLCTSYAFDPRSARAMALTVDEQIRVLKAICRTYTVGMNLSSLLGQMDQISQQAQDIPTVSILDFLKEHFANTATDRTERRSDELLQESTKNIPSVKDRPRRGGRFIKVASPDAEEGDPSIIKTGRSKRNQPEDHGDEPSSAETEGVVVSSPAKRLRKSGRR